ncbi:class I SAM-dependent methyltransferase [Longibacter sp.]|uniref:class I SAM-dependent methyltransferase n=1 Tax=Longibacter sp. TaxID=2045415 RepID=UPI003EBD8C19
MTFSYPRYLEAKRSVDERARHPKVWTTFLEAAAEIALANPGRPLRVLEIGAGVGDLAIKILNELDAESVNYTVLDVNADNLDRARERIASSLDMEASEDDAFVSTSRRNHRVRFVEDDLTSFARHDREEPDTGTYHVIVGQAIIDILPTYISLRIAHGLLRSGGLAYLPIHVDGLTEFEPTEMYDMDKRVMNVYHDTMTRTYSVDARWGPDPSGADRSDAARIDGAPTVCDAIAVQSDGARCGRDLLIDAPGAGFDVVDAGSSDWLVRPDSKTGGYVEEEDYFLACMLHFVEEALTDAASIDRSQLEDWLARRRRQLDDATLMLLVHNLDVLLRRR